MQFSPLRFGQPRPPFPWLFVPVILARPHALHLWRLRPPSFRQIILYSCWYLWSACEISPLLCAIRALFFGKLFVLVAGGLSLHCWADLPAFFRQSVQQIGFSRRVPRFLAFAPRAVLRCAWSGRRGSPLFFLARPPPKLPMRPLLPPGSSKSLARPPLLSRAERLRRAAVRHP